MQTITVLEYYTLRHKIEVQLNSIAKLSMLNYNRLPTRILVPTSFINILFNYSRNPYNKYGYWSKDGYLSLMENSTINNPKLIFSNT